MPRSSTERLAGEAVRAAAIDGKPVCWRSAYANLADDVRSVVRRYAGKCPGLDEEELTSFLMFQGGRALMRAFSTPELWCEPGAYAGTAIRRKAGTYVLKMRSPASFKEWDARVRYDELVGANQPSSPRLRPGEDEAEAFDRFVSDRSVAEPASDPEPGLLDAALSRVRELVGMRPTAERHLLGGVSMTVLAKEHGADRVRLEVAKARTGVARDGHLRGLVRLMGVGLARDPAKPWTLACVAVSSGHELEVDWPEPPAYRTPDEAWDAADRLERAYYQRDPDAVIEVKFVARRAAGVEEP